MLCLSLHQPWASLIAWREKSIETRSWYTPHRGLLAIHATKVVPSYVWAELHTNRLLYETVGKHWSGKMLGELPRGSIIAVCRLVDCQRITPRNLPDLPERAFGNYTFGRYTWILEEIQPLVEPIPARGNQGLWEFDLTEAIKQRTVAKVAQLLGAATL